MAQKVLVLHLLAPPERLARFQGLREFLLRAPLVQAGLVLQGLEPLPELAWQNYASVQAQLVEPLVFPEAPVIVVLQVLAAAQALPVRPVESV